MWNFVLAKTLFTTLLFSLLISGCKDRLHNNIPKDEAQKLLQGINVEVNQHWKKIGKGFPIHELNLKMGAFLNSEEGSCAQQSYLLARRAMMLGFRARRVGLWASSGANDIMVEVRIANEWKLFVPSSGVFYNYSLGEILNDPKLANLYIGRPKHTLYLKPAFFMDLKRIDLYQNLNNSEKNIGNTAKVSGDNLFPPPNDAEAIQDENYASYAAGIENSKPQRLQYRWDQPVNIYRIWIKWYSESDYSNEYDLFIDDGQGYKFFEINKNHLNDTDEMIFPEVKEIIGLRLQFKHFVGQDRMLIRELGIF